MPVRDGVFARSFFSDHYGGCTSGSRGVGPRIIETDKRTLRKDTRGGVPRACHRRIEDPPHPILHCCNRIGERAKILAKKGEGAEGLYPAETKQLGENRIEERIVAPGYCCWSVCRPVTVSQGLAGT